MYQFNFWHFTDSWNKALNGHWLK